MTKRLSWLVLLVGHYWLSLSSFSSASFCNCSPGGAVDFFILQLTVVDLFVAVENA